MKAESKLIAQSYAPLMIGVIFLVIPALLTVTGDEADRGIWLQDFLSLLTILGFFMMLAQVFLSRTKTPLTIGMKLPRLIKLHKSLGYFFICILLLHPFFIILPRYKEAGASPVESFIKMITGFQNFGIVLGLIAYSLMLALGMTSMFRNRLPITYRQWRIFHGILSIFFIVFGCWHAVSLGCHMNLGLSFYAITLTSIGVLILLKMYLFNKKSKKKTSHE